MEQEREIPNLDEQEMSSSESYFGISEEDSHHILSILRDKLYSNKPLAVVREYCANAIDAHTDANLDKPIKVTFPTRNSPFFKVRDYGSGLTDEEIRVIYVMYGRSTKRGNAKTIGQLGIGCKAAFAYSTEFFITSFNKGKKIRYRAFIDGSGTGAITAVSTSKTNDRGIEVEVEIQPFDHGHFISAAESILPYFKTRPIIEGIEASQIFPERDGPMIQSEPGAKREWKYFGSEWRHRGKGKVIIGGIPYPISEEQFSQNLMKHEIHIDMSSEEVSVSANREALEYTDKTIDSLSQAVNEIQEEMKKRVETLLSKCEDLNSAKTTLYSFKNDSHISTLLQHSEYTWAGIPVTEWILESLPNDPSPEMHLCSRERRRVYRDEFEVKGTVISSAAPRKNMPLVINDATSKWLMRSQTIIEELEISHLYVVKFDEAVDYTAWHKHNHTSDLTFLNLSDYEAATPIERVSDSDLTATDRKKYGKNIFVYNPNVTVYSRAKSKLWTSIGDPSEIPDAVYGDLYKFGLRILGTSNRWEYGPADLLKLMKEAGTPFTEIYGIKIRDDKPSITPPKGWHHIDDYMFNLFKDHLDSGRQLQKLRNGKELMDHVTPQLLQMMLKMKDFPNPSPMYQILKAIDELSTDYLQAIISSTEEQMLLYLNKYITKKTNDLQGTKSSDKTLPQIPKLHPDPLHSLLPLIEKATEKYPLLDEMDIFQGRSYSMRNILKTERSDWSLEEDDNLVAGVVHYISAVEATAGVAQR